jgi:hypothetical protein
MNLEAVLVAPLEAILQSLILSVELLFTVTLTLVHTSRDSSYLISHVLHYPPPPTRTALY